MRPLSPDAASLVVALTRSASPTERLSMLRSLAGRPESAVLPHIIRFLFDGDPLARAAADAARAIVAAAAPLDLVALDERCRRAWPYRDGEAKAHELTDHTGMLLSGIFSFHPDGRVRERAVIALDAGAAGDELPFLLIRLNDWVAPVAQRASAAVARRLTPANVPALVRSLPLVLRLGATTRRDNRAIVDTTLALLRDPTARASLAIAFASADVVSRRLAHRIARDGAGAEELDALVRRALHDADPVIGRDAVRAADAQLGDAAWLALYPTLERSSHVGVRRDALRTLARRHPERAHEALVRALLDPNRSMRELARAALQREHPPFDVAGFYRLRVRSPAAAAPSRALATAIAGLGESGARSDVALVAPFLRHDRPALRAAAVRALGALADVHYTAPFLALVLDPQPSVSRAARDALRRRASVVGVATFRDTLRSAAHPHATRHVLSLAAWLGKWDALALLLFASTLAGSSIDAAQQGLNAWLMRYNQSSVQPSPSQLSEITSLLASELTHIDRHSREEINSILKFWHAH